MKNNGSRMKSEFKKYQSSTHTGKIPEPAIPDATPIENVPTIEKDPMSAFFVLPGANRPHGRGTAVSGQSTGVYRRGKAPGVKTADEKVRAGSKGRISKAK